MPPRRGKKQRAPAEPGDVTRVVGYCRVSTEEQTEEGVSLAAQEDKIRRYVAGVDGLELVGVRVDAGISAKTLDRPAFHEALRDLAEGRADGILVTKLDRLTRRLHDLTGLVDSFAKQGWVLVSVNEQIDTRSAMGKFFINIIGAIAQWEREAIGERVRDSLEFLRVQGVRLGGAALGWERTDEVDADGRQIVREVKGELATIRRIVELRNGGATLREIAELLYQEGHPTKRGGRWQAQTVAAVLARQEL